MSEIYTGFRTYEVDHKLIEDIHNDDKIKIWDKRLATYPNMYVELRSITHKKHTALGKVDPTGEWIVKIEAKKAFDLEPRNREQVFALDALMDDGIPVVVLTGTAGTGKTILTLAAALQKMDEHKYSRVVITRPMSQVTRHPLGALPGDVNEKFGPYLLNYMTNLEQFGGGKHGANYLIDQGKIEAVPLQLIRGASFNNCLVIADEVQICNHHEMLTIGTRIGEGSKLIIMGDLNQRDEKIAKDKTGLHHLMNDIRIKQSPLVAVVELQKCERSETARLFAEVFEEK